MTCLSFSRSRGIVPNTRREWPVQGRRRGEGDEIRGSLDGNNLTRLSAYCWGWWSSLCRVRKYHRSTSMVDRLLNMGLITHPLPQNKTNQKYR